jgi:hypothetical protein
MQLAIASSLTVAAPPWQLMLGKAIVDTILMDANAGLSKRRGEGFRIRDYSAPGGRIIARANKVKVIARNLVPEP